MADLVIDASAATEVLVNSALGSKVARAITGHELVVPSHFHAEVLGAIASLHGRYKISDDAANEAVSKLVLAPIAAQPPGNLAAAWARRGQCSMYDMLYVLLAESLDCPLVTCDKGQADACPKAELIR